MSHKTRAAATISRLYMDAAYFLSSVRTAAGPEDRARWTNDAQDMMNAAWQMSKRHALERSFTYADYYARRGNVAATRAATVKAVESLPAVSHA